MKMAKQHEAGYVQMCNLTPHKAYKIYKIEPSEHASYGKGQLAYIIQQSKNKMRVQLPNKFLRLLKEINPNAISEYIAAIRKGKHPYLVYRKKDIDNSYDVDIFENGKFTHLSVLLPSNVKSNLTVCCTFQMLIWTNIIKSGLMYQK